MNARGQHRRHSVAWLLLGLAAVAPCRAATPMVSVGDNHALALRADGTVLAWGSDTYGQLGVNRPLIATIPARVPGMSNVRAIGGGLRHSLAVRQDGTVWAWGLNANGQLGDGTTVDRPSPVQVLGVANAGMTCGGATHSAALKQDGTVWTWGTNTTGQLGNGTPVSGSYLGMPPAPVTGLTSATSIACAWNHVTALLRDGTVWAWGENTHGELGDGTTVNRLQPVQVSGLNTVVAVNGTAALKRDGTVWEWGDNTCCGQVSPNLVPVQSAGISGAVALSRSFGSVFGTALEAISSDGVTWWEWGAGATPMVQTPEGLLSAVASAPFFTLLLKADATVLSAGLNNDGQLGNGIAPAGGFDYHSNFTPVIGISNIVAVATGDIHALALDFHGDVWAWGDDAYGELGRGAILTNTVPGVVPGLNNIVEVHAGWETSSAVDQNGNLWIWGNNDSGQLGDGTTINRAAPVLAAILNVQSAKVGAGAFTSASLALKRDGSVWAWGNDFNDQLGNGINFVNGETSCCSYLPMQVPGLANIVAIAASDHMLVVRQDGTVWAWGSNDGGELGLGTTAPSPSPVQIPGLAGVTSVAAAEHRSVALKADGSVLVWGDGPLGDGTWGSPTGQLTPVPITGLTNVVEISTTAGFTLARKADGSVWGWGLGTGVLGSNPANPQFPIPILNIGAIQQISAGGATSGLFGMDSLVYMAGANTAGQLGNGTFAQPPDFVLAVDPSLSGYLNLSTGSTVNVPSALKVPFFVSSTGGITETSAVVNTMTNFNTSDVGKSGAVFVTAKVPPGTLVPSSQAASDLNANSIAADRVAASLRATGYASAAASPSSYVLVQLTPSGWQPVVNGQLIPFATGVLGSALAAQTILNNVNTTNLTGSQFCLGYGTSAAEMTAAGRVRTIATIPDPNAASVSAVSCVPGSASPQSGLWWNPAEGGRGYTIEYNGTNIFMAAYLYDASGRSTWYGAGPAPLSGNTFAAPMTSYSGGQTLTGSYQSATQGASPGNISITFSDATHGSMNWPGGTIPIQRYEFVTNGLNSPPTATQPQTGWWWNPAEGGRGFSVEVQANSAFIASYMYDANGNPLWYASGPAALTNNNYQGSWTTYSGGQTLTGSYRPASVSGIAGSLTIQFASPTAGTLTLPDGRQIPIQRFGF